MATLAELTARYDRHVYDYVAASLGDIEVPVLDGPQSQGDVRVRPLDATPTVTVRADATWTAVPHIGIDVVRPAGGGHTHTLLATAGTATWTTDMDDTEELAVGVVDASEGAWLSHPEHGMSGLAPGRYVIRRQREQAEVQRLVAD